MKNTRRAGIPAIDLARIPRSPRGSSGAGRRAAGEKNDYPGLIWQVMQRALPVLSTRRNIP